jgi:hypothetical protein
MEASFFIADRLSECRCILRSERLPRLVLHRECCLVIIDPNWQQCVFLAVPRMLMRNYGCSRMRRTCSFYSMFGILVLPGMHLRLPQHGWVMKADLRIPICLCHDYISPVSRVADEKKPEECSCSRWYSSRNNAHILFYVELLTCSRSRQKKQAH